MPESDPLASAACVCGHDWTEHTFQGCGYLGCGCTRPANAPGSAARKRPWLDFARQRVEKNPGPPCINCLRPEAFAVQFGGDIGTQRDPEHESLWLCPDCAEALLDDLSLFHTRYASERTVRRDLNTGRPV